MLIPAIITQDRKLGRYRRVWVVFLILLLLSSFRKIARKIGIGKPMIRSPIFRIRVFASAFQKSLEEKASSKFARPIHGLFQIHWNTLNFLNATTTPNIGLYLNRII